MSTGQRVRFDVERFIDQQPIGYTQYAALFVCGLVCFIDGFDLFMIGKIAPAIADDFFQPPQAMTFVFVCQQIGLAIGAFAITPLADRYGRKIMLMVSCACFGSITLVSIFAQTLDQLAILRGVAGIFMAAGLPMALALISETTPAHRRSTFIALSLAGFSSGNIASGAVAAWLLDIYGWQSAFWIGGVVPLLCIPLLMIFVPESPKFRAERDPNDPAIVRNLRRMDPALTLTGDEVFVLGERAATARKARLTDIFTGEWALITVVVWAACLVSMTSTALMNTFLPTFFQEMAGVPIQEFAVSAMVGYLGGVAGTLVMGYLMDRLKATVVISVFYLGLCAAVLALAWVPFEASLFIVILLSWNLTQTGGQAGLNTIITQIYPPRMRSTALGWAGGAGRVGGVFAPLFGGFALAEAYSLQLTLGIAAVLPFTVAVLMIVLGAALRRDEEKRPRQSNSFERNVTLEG